jgi:cytochrome c556
MSNSIRIILALWALSEPIMSRADDSDVIKYRQLAMKQLDAEGSALGMIVAGQIPPDTLSAQLNAIATSARIAQKSFDSRIPGGNAKPEVWSNWADFSKRMQSFVENSQQMAKVGANNDVAAVTGLMLDALTCKECHDTYRNKKN